MTRYPDSSTIGAVSKLWQRMNDGIGGGVGLTAVRQGWLNRGGVDVSRPRKTINTLQRSQTVRQ